VHRARIIPPADALGIRGSRIDGNFLTCLAAARTHKKAAAVSRGGFLVYF